MCYEQVKYIDNQNQNKVNLLSICTGILGIFDIRQFEISSLKYQVKGYSSSKLWSSAVECYAQKLYVFHFP